MSLNGNDQFSEGKSYFEQSAVFSAVFVSNSIVSLRQRKCVLILYTKATKVTTQTT